MSTHLIVSVFLNAKFDILQTDIYTTILIADIMIKEHFLYQNKILEYSPLYPLEEEQLCIYALYRNDDNNPLIHESLDLLRKFSTKNNYTL